MLKKIFAILSLFFVSNLISQEINWISMDKALELQKKVPKNIIMDVYTEWCGPCKIMDKNRIGALLVYCSDSNDPQDLEGIVTERDVIELIARKGKEALNNEVQEIMSKNIISVTPQCTKMEALDLMMENQIRHLAVMDKEKLVGVLSMRDLIKQL